MVEYAKLETKMESSKVPEDKGKQKVGKQTNVKNEKKAEEDSESEDVDFCGARLIITTGKKPRWSATRTCPTE